MHQHAELAVPLDIIDSVADLIDNRSDLLSLALTCRFFTKRLIPSVLDYCEIRAPFEARYLWKHLAENTRLARRVRTLRVVTEDYKLPKEIKPEERGVDEDGQLEEVFLQSVRCMSHLVTFRWMDPHLRRWSFNRVGYDQLWDVFSVSCPRLRHLELCDNVNVLSEEALVGRSGRLSTLDTLWSCKYRVSFQGISGSWRLSPVFITNFISHSSSLRSLDLIAISLAVHISPLGPQFGEMVLPSLSSPNTLSRFLRLNSTLESLALDSPYSLQSLVTGDLPNLHHFWSVGSQWATVCLTMPPMRELYGTFGNFFDQNILDAFRSVSRTLTTLYIYLCCIDSKPPVHDIDNPFPGFHRDVAHALSETLRGVDIQYRGALSDGYFSSRHW
ncbi:hypothetical protein JAAARDRAFT_58011 [Jaapia argillacea MUCL 33604]|uniref:F-box domain-containing protein n=1 Tax=Jaapia argillacea MUCL 33604 TaxID=933084 RepID=A0A067PTZ8_9AGAM|nr:hypothetical protein JAAARDRAFT_58011 [Jaapia argillacea MUCL 33604]